MPLDLTRPHSAFFVKQKSLGTLTIEFEGTNQAMEDLLWR